MNVSLFLEIKNEYTEHLVDTLAPFVYEGLTSIYKESVRIAEEANSDDKTLLIFQKLLQSVPNWNQIKIEEETIRIKQQSNTADYLDDLVKAVVKSNIILLAYSSSISNIIGQAFYNNLTTSTFIHRCYTECSKDAHNNPYLFYHNIEPMDLKRNQIIIQQNIQSGVARAIRKILPISMILKEYLSNSINIIYEQPDIELVGKKPSEPIVAPVGNQSGNPPTINPTGPGLMDIKLQKEVMEMIKSDHGKSDAQKVKDMINLDKIITSLDHKVADAFKNPVVRKRLSEVLVAPRLIETDDRPENRRLTKLDKEVLNINFEDQTTVSGSISKKSISATSIPNNPAKIGKVQRIRADTSERIDPSKVDLIEDYGMKGGKKQKKHR